MRLLSPRLTQDFFVRNTDETKTEQAPSRDILPAENTFDFFTVPGDQVFDTLNPFRTMFYRLRFVYCVAVPRRVFPASRNVSCRRYSRLHALAIQDRGP